MSKRAALTIALVLMGVYLIAQGLTGVGRFGHGLLELVLYYTADMAALRDVLEMSLYVLPPVLAGTLLIVGCSRLAGCLIRDDGPLGPSLPTGWEPSAFAIGCFLLGASLIIGAVAGTAGRLANLVAELIGWSWAYDERSDLSTLAPGILRALLGLYLLVGAPGLRGFVLRRVRGRTMVR